ncbi:ATP-grasp domain-containing protein [Mycolicibacterium boenickei]
MSVVIALGAGGPDGHAADCSSRLIAEAASRGDKLVVVDRAPNIVSVPRDHVGIAAVVEADFADVDAVRDAIHPFLNRAEAIVGFREFSLIPAAILADERDFAWNTVHAVETCRKKDRARDLLRSRGFEQPTVIRFESRSDAVEYLSSARGPMIVKPRDAYGSQGVRLVRDPREAPSAVDQSLRYGPEILVEDYVEGDEYSVEGILVAGVPHVLATTRKAVTDPPYFVELQHEQPSHLSRETEALLEATAADAVKAIGLTHSLFHVEAWVTADGRIVCGEVHGRVGGDWIHALTAFRRPGLELFGAVLDDVLGRTVELPSLVPGRAATAIAITAPAGQVVAVGTVPELSADVAVLACDLSVTVGDDVGTLEDSFGRAGVVALGASDARFLASAADSVRESAIVRTSQGLHPTILSRLQPSSRRLAGGTGQEAPEKPRH